MTTLLQHPDKFFFDGEWVAPATGSTIQVRDSASEEVFLTVAEAQAPDVEKAVAAARRAFDSGPWPRMSHAERATWLNRIADGFAAKAQALGEGWTRESGVLARVSAHAHHGAAKTFRTYAGYAETFAWEERHTGEQGEPALLVREPVGVVAAIVPWNVPYMLMAYKVAPALLAGCTVIIKASPEAPTAPTCSLKSAPRSACQPAWSTCLRLIAMYRNCWSAIRGWTRSASPARLRRAGASPRSAGTASRG